MLHLESGTRSAIPDRLMCFAGHIRANRRETIYRPNGVPDWQLLLTTCGGVRVFHTQGEILAIPGMVVLLSPGTAYTCEVAQKCRRWEAATVHFRPCAEWSDLCRWGEFAPGVRVTRTANASQCRSYLHLIDDLITLQGLALPLGKRLVRSTLEQLLLRLASADQTFSGHLQDPRILKVLELLAQEEGVPISRTVLALAVRLSPGRLSMLFRQQLGISLPQYRERLRLERAALLLAATDQSIASIGMATGYRDQFYFSNRFRRTNGISPTAWRRSVDDQ